MRSGKDKKDRMLEQFSISTYEISSHSLGRSTLQPCVGGKVGMGRSSIRHIFKSLTSRNSLSVT
jgi:hypothetical protein